VGRAARGRRQARPEGLNQRRLAAVSRTR
jgi:hypothetical protein